MTDPATDSVMSWDGEADLGREDAPPLPLEEYERLRAAVW